MLKALHILSLACEAVVLNVIFCRGRAWKCHGGQSLHEYQDLSYLVWTQNCLRPWSVLGCRIFHLHKRALLLCLPFSGPALFQPCRISPCPQLHLSLPPISTVLYSSLCPHLPNSESHFVHNNIYLFSPSLAYRRHLHFYFTHYASSKRY